MKDNFFGKYSLILLLVFFILFVVSYVCEIFVLYIISLIGFAISIVLAIIGLFKDKKKTCSIISLVIYAIIIGLISFFLFVVLPGAVDDFVGAVKDAYLK